MLAELRAADADEYWELLARSRAHLGRYGDFEADRSMTHDDVVNDLGKPPGGTIRLGLRLDGALVGRIDLDPVDPPRWTVGYWLDPAHVGGGWMTIAGRAVVGHARSIAVDELYAGVTHGNDASAAVLRRLGFERIADLPRHSRWRLQL